MPSEGTSLAVAEDRSPLGGGRATDRRWRSKPKAAKPWRLRPNGCKAGPCPAQFPTIPEPVKAFKPKPCAQQQIHFQWKGLLPVPPCRRLDRRTDQGGCFYWGKGVLRGFFNSRGGRKEIRGDCRALTNILWLNPKKTPRCHSQLLLRG